MDADFVIYMKERGIHIWGEIELAYHFARGRVLAITGTNGKTTTISRIIILMIQDTEVLLCLIHRHSFFCRSIVLHRVMAVEMIRRV